jgi:hypothetical protein
MHAMHAGQAAAGGRAGGGSGRPSGSGLRPGSWRHLVLLSLAGWPGWQP